MYAYEFEVKCREMGIVVKVMDTYQATTTFNVLQEEGRRVAGAFLPINW